MSIFNIKNIPEAPACQNDKPLIMIIDDEVENINVLKQLLDNKFNILTCCNGREALQMISDMPDPENIQLILSDQRMPEMTGVEFLAQTVDKIPETIRIILTGYSDTQVIIDAINKARLYKFMTKPFDPMELTLTVQRGVEAFQMRQDIIEHTLNLEQKVRERTQELQQKNQELNKALALLEQLSLTDQLTGVNNRRFLQQFIPKELAQLQRDHFNAQQQYCFGFLMIDADHFKSVNDNYGHEAGDQLLIQLAEIFKHTCRESDWLIRWGGEEFLIFGRFIDRQQLHNLAQRLCSNVAEHVFDLGNGVQLHKTCSIGVVAFPFLRKNINALSWQQTIALADAAMYIAKKSGRNAWVSLEENEIADGQLFYQQIMKNPQALADRDKAAISSSLPDNKLCFK